MTVRTSLAYCALVSAFLVGSAVAAQAQTAAPADAQPASEPVSVDDIVVTARKRDEQAQDVPISITAFSGEALERMGVRSFNDLTLSNPNVKIETAQGGIGSIGSAVAIRGNIQSASTILPDPAVGTYMDGHVISRTYGTLGLSVDVASVQTLKGPQGTLFGRNTTGGALLVATRDPNTDGVDGYLQAEGGELETFNFGGAVNVPMNDRAALRIAYQNNSRGDFESFSNGVGLGARDGEELRAKLLLRPTDTTTVWLTLESTEETARQAIAPVSHPNNPPYDNLPVTVVGAGPGQAPIDPRARRETSTFDGNFYGLRINQEIGSGTLKLIAGRREYSVDNAASLPPGLGYTFQNKPNNDDTSVELQYIDTLFNDRVDIAGGLYYFKDHLNEDQNTFLYSGVSRTRRILNAESESKSAYFQATAHLTDRLNLTGGLRYTADDKSSVLRSATLSATTAGDTAAALANPSARWSDSLKKTNYLISVDYKPVDGVMIYASHSTGYRASGSGVDRLADNQPANPNYLVVASFAPEEVKNFEVGFKTDFLDRRLRLNGVVFHQDYQGYQYSATNPTTFARETFNVDATIDGFELDGQFRFDTGTTVMASYGFTDATVSDGSSPQDGVGLPWIPESTFSFGVTQNIAIGNDDLDLSANVSQRSKFWTSIEDRNDAARFDEVGETTIDALTLVNLSATYTRGSVEYSLNATNVTDEHYFTSVTRAGTAINFGALGVPRQVTARIKYAF